MFIKRLGKIQARLASFFRKRPSPLYSHKKGATAVEFALLVGLIAVVAMLAIQNVGQQIDAIFCRAANVLTQAAGGAVTPSCRQQDTPVAPNFSWSPQNITGIVGKAESWTLSAATIDNGDTLTYALTTVSPTASGLALSTSSTPTLTWASPVLGTYQLTLKVSDQHSNTLTKNISLTVAAPNLAWSPENITGIVGKAGSWTLSAATIDNGDTLTYALTTVSPAASGLALSTSSTPTLTWTSPVLGTYQLTLKVSDQHSNTLTKNISLTVAAPNLAWSPQNITGIVGKAGSWTLSAATIDNDASLTYALTTVTPAASGLGLSTSSTPTLTWTSPVVGTYQLTLTVGDQYGDTLTKNISLTVGPQVSVSHFEGANGQTTGVADQNGVAWTLSAGALSNAQAKFGTTSYYSGNAHNGATFGTFQSAGTTLDYTIEMWFYWVGGTLYPALYSGSSMTQHLLDGNGSMGFWVSGQRPIFTPSPSKNTWHFYVLQRQAGVISVYLDGVLLGTTAILASFDPSGFLIGSQNLSDRTTDVYIDELRFTIGQARYSGTSITVPTAAFPDN